MGRGVTAGVGRGVGFGVGRVVDVGAAVGPRVGDGSGVGVGPAVGPAVAVGQVVGHAVGPGEPAGTLQPGVTDGPTGTVAEGVAAWQPAIARTIASQMAGSRGRRVARCAVCIGPSAASVTHAPVGWERP